MNSRAFVKKFELRPYQEGVLSGLKFAAKDQIDIAGHVTGCGNPTWAKTHLSAQVHAICIEQLLHEGARFIGKTICDELAFSLIGENYFHGTPLNPKAPDRVPGGSSSGSASSVACGEVDFALGTDTGGSIRVPASNCGVWGFRPSYGKISVAGVNPLAPSFDTVGVLARDADILEKVVKVLLAPSFHANNKKTEIFFLEEAFLIADPEIQETFTPFLKSFKKISWKDFYQPIEMEFLFKTFSFLQWCEIWSTLGSWIEKEKPQFGSPIATSFKLAKQADRTRIQENITIRFSLAHALNYFLEEHRFLCIPTTPALAPKLGTVGNDRSQGNYYPRLLAYDAIASLGGLSQISCPIASFNGIPVGLSFIGKYGNDLALIQMAKAFYVRFIRV